MFWGETIDKGEQLDNAEHWVIHRDPPAFDEQSPVVEIWKQVLKLLTY